MDAKKATACLAAALVLGVVSYLVTTPSKQAAHAKHTDAQVEYVVANNSANTSAASANVSNIAVDQSLASQGLSDILRWTSDDQRQLQAWMLDVGHGGAKRKTYESYSNEALIAMAKNGDVHAMMALAGIAYEKKGYETAKGISLTAAAHGSTEALERLGSLEDVHYSHSIKTPTEKERLAIGVLAWYRLASMRGDELPEISRVKIYTEINNIQLTPEMESQIQQLAQSRYESLQKARFEMGFGEFNNSVPMAVSKFFSRQKLQRQASIQ